MTKAAIPIVRTQQPDLDLALAAIKQNMDAMTGQARNVTRLDPLPGTASTAEIIARVNAIVDRLQ